MGKEESTLSNEVLALCLDKGRVNDDEFVVGGGGCLKKFFREFKKII